LQRKVCQDIHPIGGVREESGGGEEREEVAAPVARRRNKEVAVAILQKIGSRYFVVS